MFETVVARLATVPNRRKTVVFISTGVPIDFGATRDCPLEQKDRMLDVFARASRANINIYSIDPGGYGGYERYLQDPIRRAGRPAPTTVSDPTARSLARLRRDFLEIMAGYTGASATVNSDEIETGIDRIFTEASSYYLLGYQTSNGKPDGKYRKVEVKVKRPGTTVRTRSGYFAPKDTGTARDAKDTPAVNDLGLVGLMNSPALPLRAAAVPVALSGHGRDADVAVVLSVRLPSPRGPVPEAVTVVRNLYDSEGRAGPPVLEKTELTLLPSTGDELRYDLYWKLPLAPGRYQLRLNATSKAVDKSGTVYADIDVPDYTRAPLSLSAMVLGGKGAPVPRTDALAGVLPIIPTAARDFAPGDNIAGFVRVFQGGDAPLRSVDMAVQVFDVNDRKLMDTARDAGRRRLRRRPIRRLSVRPAARPARARAAPGERHRHARRRPAGAARSRLSRQIAANCSRAVCGWVERRSRMAPCDESRSRRGVFRGARQGEAAEDRDRLGIDVSGPSTHRLWEQDR